MAFRWRADDDPLIVVIVWILFPLKNQTKKKRCPSGPSDKTFWIRAWHRYAFYLLCESKRMDWIQNASEVSLWNRLKYKYMPFLNLISVLLCLKCEYRLIYTRQKRNAPLRFSPLRSPFYTKMLIVMLYSFLIKSY